MGASKMRQDLECHYPKLYEAAFSYPAIDSHAHPILREEHRDRFPFEGLVSEAQGDALIQDAIHTVACKRATAQIRRLYNLDERASWDDLKLARASFNYVELCKMCFEPARIQCILIDDGLGGSDDFAEDYTWHDQFTNSPTRRILRVEVVAEGILKDIFQLNLSTKAALEAFTASLTKRLKESAGDSNVVGFKSIVCYRTGLNVAIVSCAASLESSLVDLFKSYKEEGRLRLAHKALNDLVVRIAVEMASEHDIPVQFHTGLGDNDITLSLSSPAEMQPLIKAYPKTKFVLLHSSYPYTREAGYLTAVYSNVYLDFSEVFPLVSGPGQRSIIQQVLELSPTNKIMWSSDGRWWPESFYLGSYQARQGMYEVLKTMIDDKELSEADAVTIVRNALFHNSNRVYGLNLPTPGLA